MWFSSKRCACCFFGNPCWCHQDKTASGSSRWSDNIQWSYWLFWKDSKGRRPFGFLEGSWRWEAHTEYYNCPQFSKLARAWLRTLEQYLQGLILRNVIYHLFKKIFSFSLEKLPCLILWFVIFNSSRVQIFTPVWCYFGHIRASAEMVLCRFWRPVSH